MKSSIMLSLLTGVLSLFTVTIGFAAPIDLTKEILYVREGFSAEWLQVLPGEGEPGWLAIQPGHGGERASGVRS